MGSVDVTPAETVETQIPPASAAWYFNFNLEGAAFLVVLLDTTDLSRMVFQFRPSATVQS